MRKVIVHYHYFKNAGSSLNEILWKNFQRKFRKVEFEGVNNQRDLCEWLVKRENVVAVASHSAQFPLPVIEACEIFPVLFLRHPLDRIRSAYGYIRKSRLDTYGAEVAKAMSVAEYVRHRLDRRHETQCRNQQTFRMARLIPGKQGSDLDRALAALIQLPFVGIVEDFSESLAALEDWLKPHFPGFETYYLHRNSQGRMGSSLEERLEGFREELGDSLYDELLEANLKDISLHHAATVRFRNGRRAQLKSKIGAQAELDSPATEPAKVSA